LSKKKDEICGPPEQQKLPAREASVSWAKPKTESNSETKKILNNISTINQFINHLKERKELWH
jgi:hypothetical protein